jgi:hypothetical protein
VIAGADELDPYAYELDPYCGAAFPIDRLGFAL